MRFLHSFYLFSKNLLRDEAAISQEALIGNALQITEDGVCGKSGEKWLILSHLIPPLWISPPCDIRETCLGKYWGWKGIMTSLVLTSMILNYEYFDIFYKHFWGLRVLWLIDSKWIILKLLLARKSWTGHIISGTQDQEFLAKTKKSPEFWNFQKFR